jgi:membrane associated rhomboid family serine protease
MQYEQGPGFADLLTPRVLTVLGTLVACFVAQSVFADQLPELSLYPIPAGFQPWQPLTYSLSQPTPVTAIVDWIVLTFLLEFGWAALGTRTFWLATASTWAFATLGTVALGAIWPEAGRVPISGTGWWFGAILVFWAMKHRGRSLRLLFAFELRAEVAVVVFGALDVLRLLYYRDLGSAHLVLAFFASFTVLLFDEDNWRRWRLQRRRKEIERQLSRLTVLEGGKGQERPRRRGVDDRVN